MAATGVTMSEVTGLIAQLGGLAILGGTIAAAVAAAYRWYAAEEVPRGLAILAGLGGVALYLNTTSALAEVISRAGGATETQVALFNIAAFASGTAGAEVGRRVGDRFEAAVFIRQEGVETDDDVGRLGRALGRVREVQLPAAIEDVVGYDPVEERTKEDLAGTSFVYPRGIDEAELRDRLVSRLKTDYGVGTVDVDFADDGSIAHLGVGRRAAGIGPTLPPATNAVAVRADPPYAASAGDLVQLWETQPARRVLTGELRGVAGDAVTLAIDAADTPTVDPTASYRLVTLPVEDRPDREFASLLRAAEETYTSVAVEAGSPIAGAPVGALAVTVAAVASEAGETVALPTRDAVIEPGATLFALGRPDRLRRLAAAATAVPAGVSTDRPPAAEVASPASSAGETGGEGGAEAADASPAASEPPAGADRTGPATGDEAAEAAADGSSTEQPGRSGDPAPPSFDELSDRLDDAAAPTGVGDADGDAGGNDAAGSDAASDTARDSNSTEEPEQGEEPQSDQPAGEDEPTGGLSDLDAFGVSEADASDVPADFEDIAFGDSGDDDDEADDDDDEADDDDDEADDDGDAGTDGEADDDDGSGDDTDGSDAGGSDSGEVGGGDAGDAAASDSDARDDGAGGDTAGDDGGVAADGDDDADAGEGADSEDGTDDGGGGGTFAQLKEEFESGDPDWADDISDSPGGDMRLDE